MYTKKAQSYSFEFCIRVTEEVEYLSEEALMRIAKTVGESILYAMQYWVESKADGHMMKYEVSEEMRKECR